MNILEKLISENAKNKNQFAKLVGETPQTINSQVKSKNPMMPAITYAKLLKVKLEFEDNGCKVELDYSKE